MKIHWSGRSHNYSKKDINYLINIIKKADPLTQGKYLKEFEYVFSKYIKKNRDTFKKILKEQQKLIKKNIQLLLDCTEEQSAWSVLVESEMKSSSEQNPLA